MPQQVLDSLRLQMQMTLPQLTTHVTTRTCSAESALCHSWILLPALLVVSQRCIVASGGSTDALACGGAVR